MATTGSQSAYSLARHAVRHCQSAAKPQVNCHVQYRTFATTSSRVFAGSNIRNTGSSVHHTDKNKRPSDSDLTTSDIKAMIANGATTGGNVTTFESKTTISGSVPTTAESKPKNAESKIDQLSTRVEEKDRPAEVRQQPRWSYTPEGMKAPFSPHITKNPARSIWHVNSDPNKLDQMYVKLLGRDGDKLLPEEIKWLAVTHKSFDQGRRGFNDKLAYLGRQAVVLESTRSIVTSALAKEGATVADEHGRAPFEHPALARIDNLNVELPQKMVAREKVEALAIAVGLDKVLRWKPAKPENLAGSGQQIVLNAAVFAIVGAIMLQHGAGVADRVIRERILRPLTLRQERRSH